MGNGWTPLWNLALAVSVGWLLYRIYQVFQKPLPDLIDALGIDIPPVPDVALSTISTDSVLLYWKPPENYHSPLRHFVQVNGITVGEFNRDDASVLVTGLEPGEYYGIRAIATNTANNSSYGHLIQCQTIPLTGHRGTRLLAAANTSAPQRPARRTGSERQVHTANNGNNHVSERALQTPALGDGQEENETVASLTKRLDSLRRQHENTLRQNAEELEDGTKVVAALTKERDEKKEKVEERERQNAETKKQINEGDKVLKTKLRVKATMERKLQLKQTEKQKRDEDIFRWRAESKEMKEDTERIIQATAEMIESHEEKMKEERVRVNNIHAENKELEEGIHIFGVKIKALEEDRKRQDRDQNEDERAFERRDKEEDAAHEAKIREMQANYTNLWQVKQQLSADCQQLEDRNKQWVELRAKDPSQFTSMPWLDQLPSEPMQQRRIRQGNSRASTMSHSSNNYSLNIPAMSNTSPSFSPAFPLYGNNNGTAILNAADRISMSQQEVDILTGGALMSPTANMLLPSNLLGDDDFMSRQYIGLARENDNGGVSQNVFPYASPGFEDNGQDPQSPLSMNSRSPSLLSSPQDSLQNLHGYNSTRERLAENDRYQSNSPYSSAVAPGTNLSNPRRIGALFNFRSQRGKSLLNESPTLGTLKQGQSQSFPRNLELGSLAPSGSARRRSGSGAWTNPLEKFLPNRNVGNGTDADLTISQGSAATRRRRKHLFGNDLDSSEMIGLEPSSRPASIYSYNESLLLPRPSSDSQPFGWGSSDLPQRSSPLGGPLGVLTPWSRSQSRRESVHYGSTSNLSIGSTPLEPEGYSSPYGPKLTPPAPIGTERFSLSKRNNPPKLNPAAPSFTTRLFNRNDAKKASKGEKLNEKAAEKAKNKETEATKDFDSDSLYDDHSPSNSRISRDAHSIRTSASNGEFDPLDSANSVTHSSDMGASSAPKETIMQRLVRKGSSSKFNVSWNKERNLFSKKTGEPSTPTGVDEEEPDYMGKNAENVTNTPQHDKSGRGLSSSWSRVMRKSKKSDVAAPEGPTSESSGRASAAGRLSEELGDEDEE